MLPSKGIQYWKELIGSPILNSEQLSEVDKLFQKFLTFTNVCVFGNKVDFLDFFDIPSYRIFDEEITDLVYWFSVKRDDITKLVIYFDQGKNDEQLVDLIENIYEEFDKNAYIAFLKVKKSLLPLVIHRSAKEMFAFLSERLPANLERAFGKELVEYFEIQLKPVELSNGAFNQWRNLIVLTKKFFESSLTVLEDQHSFSIESVLKKIDRLDNDFNFSFYFLNSFDDIVIEIFFSLMDKMKNKYGYFSSLLFHSLISRDKIAKHAPRITGAKNYEEYFEIIHLPLEYKVSILRDFAALLFYQKIILEKHHKNIMIFDEMSNCVLELKNAFDNFSDIEEFEKRFEKLLLKTSDRIEIHNLESSFNPVLVDTLNYFVSLHKFTKNIDLLSMCIQYCDGSCKELDKIYVIPYKFTQNGGMKIAFELFNMCFNLVRETDCFTSDGFYIKVSEFISKIMDFWEDKSNESEHAMLIEREELKRYLRDFKDKIVNILSIFAPANLTKKRQENARAIVREQLDRLKRYITNEISITQKNIAMLIEEQNERILKIKKDIYEIEEIEALVRTMVEILDRLKNMK
ncbi:MAG: hypothetical protein QW279_06290 [Candidatus Jordarchaeaceae archaeon]